MSSIIVIGSIVLFSYTDKTDTDEKNMSKDTTNTETRYNKAMRKILEPFRQGRFPVLNKKRYEQWLFYEAVLRTEPDNVQAFLDKGFDPNYCHGECGWSDSNPLAILAEIFFGTYHRTLRGEEIPDPTPDVETLWILVKGGADVNRRPYIWKAVHEQNDEFLNQMGEYFIDGKRVDVYKDRKAYYIKDVNRILEAFLKAGADPDKLGHPYPFSWQSMKVIKTDEQAQEYFSKGTRAINEAIEKGIAWESQVDLLLQYTQLDEESLKAAERSNDTAMLKKIQKLWEVQKKNNIPFEGTVPQGAK